MHAEEKEGKGNAARQSYQQTVVRNSDSLHMSNIACAAASSEPLIGPDATCKCTFQICKSRCAHLQRVCTTVAVNAVVENCNTCHAGAPKYREKVSSQNTLVFNSHQ